jgi:hypothetical protein
MFSLLLGSWTGIDFFPEASMQGRTVISQADFYQVIMLFGAGYAIIWILLGLMYRRAAGQALALRLSPLEKVITSAEIRGAWMNASLGLLSLLLAWLGYLVISGLIYVTIPMLLWVNHRIFLKGKKRLAPGM